MKEGSTAAHSHRTSVVSSQTFQEAGSSTKVLKTTSSMNKESATTHSSSTAILISTSRPEKSKLSASILSSVSSEMMSGHSSDSFRSSPGLSLIH
ncbi:hypothetical protein K469DRAFT_125637 [Zopfia rhizophila CBS 207.26]|uniref:Uncharacterized protein n=1 Tax=Zopfia rhizophila CBS 207.26 TaxID=1314779 RepID=A0A6A6EBK0_9PEZI|nr:hypothetical protein K469DRAFT_125637 [Zopfia rhizophila CBS 207.26]